MKLVVCGCSYNARSPNLTSNVGTHWSEILAEKLNAKLINLAVGGASNNFIKLQLETAKNLKPDFIIFNATTPSRLEIKNLSYKNYFFGKKLKEYTYKNCYFNSFTGNGNLIGLPIIKLLEENSNIPITNEQVNTIEDYINNIYDEIWKKQIDRYVLSSAIYELYLKKFNFLFNPYLLVDDFEIIDDIKNKHFVTKDFDYKTLEKIYRLNQNEEDQGYHTTVDGQIFIAEKYYCAIKEYTTKYGISFDE